MRAAKDRLPSETASGNKKAASTRRRLTPNNSLRTQNQCLETLRRLMVKNRSNKKPPSSESGEPKNAHAIYKDEHSLKRVAEPANKRQ